MRILILVRGGSRTRSRFTQYLGVLAEANLRFVILPCGDDWLASLRRCGQVLTQRGFDLAWIEDDVFPGMPSWLETCLSGLLPKRRIYDVNPHLWRREKLERVLNKAWGVITHEDWVPLLEPICSRVLTLPEHVVWSDFTERKPLPERLTLAWCPRGDWERQWQILKPQLETVARDLDFVLLQVGGESRLEAAFTIEYRERSERPEHLPSAHLAMVTEGDAMEAAERERDMVHWLANGVAVVADGFMGRLLEQTGAGVAVSEPDDWTQEISRLLKQVPRCEALGNNGRDWVKHNRSLIQGHAKLIPFLKG